MEYNIKKIIIGSRESKLAKAHVEIFKREFYDKFKKKSRHRASNQIHKNIR